MSTSFSSEIEFVDQLPVGHSASHERHGGTHLMLSSCTEVLPEAAFAAHQSGLHDSSIGSYSGRHPTKKRAASPMTEDVISEDIRRFIDDYISSIAQLEALVLLRGSPDAWSIADLAGRLYVANEQAQGALDALVAAGLLSADNGKYRFSETNPHGEIIDRLLAVYSRHLIPVTNLVHRKPRVSAFAEAFRLRRD